MRIPLAALVVLFFVLCTPSGAADPVAPPNALDKEKSPEQADLDAMQGRWTYTVANKAGTPIRIEKAIDGTSDTVTHFDANGNVIHAHASTFELNSHGPLRVFTIKTSVVVAGPNQGEQRPVPRSYVYRIENGNMIECWGLLETDRGPPSVILWKRVKE